tara:strand:+ start:129 stop:557 length:429 start_codon:yes stop_codon:yes gene_type:complete
MNSRVITKGFTLIELLIVVAIVAITTTLAYPSYQKYIQDGHRSDAQQGMLQTAAILERIYSRNGGYPHSNSFTDLPKSAVYTFEYKHDPDLPAGSPDFRSLKFTLKAKPKAGSVQSSDRCAVLEIDQTGKTTVSGNGNDCWK